MPGVWVFPGGVVELDGVDRHAATAAGALDADHPTTFEGDADAEELAHRACAIRELGEEAGISLPADAELRPWSRWITPERSALRFDTRFYVALAPPHSPPKADGVEMIDAGWFAPQQALEQNEAGELDLVFPTIKHLEELATFATANEVMAAAVDRPIQAVMPRIDGDGGREILPYLPD